MTECKRRVRGLHVWEIEEARCVFEDSLDYRRVLIHECDPFPNRIDRLGRRLKGMEPSNLPNAVTLGNRCIFPVMLPEHPIDINDSDHYKWCWLVHELTHVWQFQNRGWIYLFDALSAQFKSKEKAYHYGDEEELKRIRKDGGLFKNFNPEQQGDLASDFYRKFRKGENVEALLPFILDLRQVQKLQKPRGV